MLFRVNATRVKCMGRSMHSTAYQGTRERARISVPKFRFMIIKILAIRISGRVCGRQMVMENRSRDLTSLWSDEDNLVGRPMS